MYTYCAAMQATTTVAEAYQIKRDPDNLAAIRTPAVAVKHRPVNSTTGSQKSRITSEEVFGTVDMYHPKHV